MPGWTVCLAFPVVLPGPTSASGSLRLTAGPWQVLTTYDSFPEAYTAETEANLLNGYYMRPAILDLAGDVAGRRILDVGCGSGPCPQHCMTGARSLPAWIPAPGY
jgi:hypothetical protein